MAGQRTKIAEGFKEAVDMIKATDKSLNAEKVLQFLLDSSRIETLGNIGQDAVRFSSASEMRFDNASSFRSSSFS